MGGFEYFFVPSDAFLILYSLLSIFSSKNTQDFSLQFLFWTLKPLVNLFTANKFHLGARCLKRFRSAVRVMKAIGT